MRPWDNEKEFQSVYDSVLKDNYFRALVPIGRAWVLYDNARSLRDVEGDVAEVGVWRGGSAKILAEATKGTNKTLYLFDTFTGMPYADPLVDKHPVGSFGDTNVDEVRTYLKDYSNVKIIQGIFPETAACILDKRFCFVHIDADQYKSIMDSSEFFFPRLFLNGTLVYDDYGFVDGARKATLDFVRSKTDIKHGEVTIPIDNGHSLTGQYCVVKIRGV